MRRGPNVYSCLTSWLTDTPGRVFWVDHFRRSTLATVGERKVDALLFAQVELALVHSAHRLREVLQAETRLVIVWKEHSCEESMRWLQLSICVSCLLGQAQELSWTCFVLPRYNEGLSTALLHPEEQLTCGISGAAVSRNISHLDGEVFMIELYI